MADSTPTLDGVKDKGVTFDNGDGATWQVIARVGGRDMRSFKDAFAYLAKQIAAAQTWDSMPTGWGTGDGFRTIAFLSCRYQCPVKDQIRQLREKTDDLENSLKCARP